MTAEEWPDERIRLHDVERDYRKFDGRVMFPSSHDITPGNIEACLTVLGKLLAAGNEVLIVSKPQFECIQVICDRFKEYLPQILFRFTIGAKNDEILSFWEPGAPSYKERLSSLLWAFHEGFNTSVSIEPMLDAENVVDLVHDLDYRVTDSIWIGKMNHIRKNIIIDSDEVAEAIHRIEQGQTDDKIRDIYNALKNHPLIKWKGGIKKIIDPRD